MEQKRKKKKKKKTTNFEYPLLIQFEAENNSGKFEVRTSQTHFNSKSLLLHLSIFYICVFMSQGQPLAPLIRPIRLFICFFISLSICLSRYLYVYLISRPKASATVNKSFIFRFSDLSFLVLLKFLFIFLPFIFTFLNSLFAILFLFLSLTVYFSFSFYSSFLSILLFFLFLFPFCLSFLSAFIDFLCFFLSIYLFFLFFCTVYLSFLSDLTLFPFYFLRSLDDGPSKRTSERASIE